jgi:hypothetical protein
MADQKKPSAFSHMTDMTDDKYERDLQRHLRRLPGTSQYRDREKRRAYMRAYMAANKEKHRKQSAAHFRDQLPEDLLRRLQELKSE